MRHVKWKLEEVDWKPFQTNTEIGKITRDPDGHIIIYGPQQKDKNHWITLTIKATNCGRPNCYNHNCFGLINMDNLEELHSTGSPCGAGAGSLGIAPYHGWIRNGYLIIDGGIDNLPENHSGAFC